MGRATEMPRRRPTSEACRAAAALGRTVDRALAGGDLSPAGYRLLAYLQSGSVAATVLADKLAVSRPTVTATVSWLETRGFVTRHPDAVDRRRVAIEITPAGVRAVADADEVVAVRLAEVLSIMDEHDADAVVFALEGLLGALNEFRAQHHRRSGVR